MPYTSYSGFVGPFAVGSDVWKTGGRNPIDLTRYPTMSPGSKTPYVPPSVLGPWAASHPDQVTGGIDPAAAYAQQQLANFRNSGAGSLSQLPYMPGGVSGSRAPGQGYMNQAGAFDPTQATYAGAGAIDPLANPVGLTATPGTNTGLSQTGSALGGGVPGSPPASATLAESGPGRGRSKKAGSNVSFPTPPASATLAQTGPPDPSAILTGTTGQGSGIWGSVPNVPDPTATAGTAIGGDIANLPGLLGLAGQTNAFNTQQAIAPYIANLPGYQNMINQSSGNILAGLQGQVPQDVINLLQQQGAEGGVGGGFGPGSENTNSAYLRALGLTSLGQQQAAEQNLTGAIQRTPTAPLFNVASFMNTPADQQAAQMAANMYASAPNPQQQGEFLMNLFQRLLSQQSGAGGGGGVTLNRGNMGGGGPPTDLFGNPMSQLGANAGGPGSGVPGASYGGGGVNIPGFPTSGGYPFMSGNPYIAGDATGAITGTMPPGGYGTPQGPNQGTGEGTLSSGFWDSILGDLSGTGATGGTMPSGGYGTPQGAGVGTGEGGPMIQSSSFPSGINPNDPLWQSILDPVGYYMGDYAPQGQTSQDITPAGMAGGTADYLNPGFDWSQLIDPYSSGGFDFSGGGGDFGGG